MYTSSHVDWSRACRRDTCGRQQTASDLDSCVCIKKPYAIITQYSFVEKSRTRKTKSHAQIHAGHWNEAFWIIKYIDVNFTSISKTDGVDLINYCWLSGYKENRPNTFITALWSITDKSKYSSMFWLFIHLWWSMTHKHTTKSECLLASIFTASPASIRAPQNQYTALMPRGFIQTPTWQRFQCVKPLWRACP